MKQPNKRTVPMIAGKLRRYAGKALKAGDSFEASEKDGKVLFAARLATYGTRDQVRQSKPVRQAAVATETVDETAVLRARYEVLAGKKAHNFWKADRIRDEINKLPAADTSDAGGNGADGATDGNTPSE